MNVRRCCRRRGPERAPSTATATPRHIPGGTAGPRWGGGGGRRKAATQLTLTQRRGTISCGDSFAGGTSKVGNVAAPANPKPGSASGTHCTAKARISPGALFATFDI